MTDQYRHKHAYTAWGYVEIYDRDAIVNRGSDDLFFRLFKTASVQWLPDGQGSARMVYVRYIDGDEYSDPFIGGEDDEKLELAEEFEHDLLVSWRVWEKEEKTNDDSFCHTCLTANTTRPTTRDSSR